MDKYQEALDILHGFANGNLIRETTCDYQRDKNDEYKDILRELVDKATPKKHLLKPMTGYDEAVASHIVCPCCRQPIVNVWNRAKYKPRYCHYCGQRLDWSDERC